LARAVDFNRKLCVRLKRMEGPLLVIKSWALVAILVWAYRRYFERVARPDLEFEAWCRERPLLVALPGSPAERQRWELALRARLTTARRVVVSLGGWPWPNYELELTLSNEGNVLGLRIARAELRKAHAAPPPCLVLILRDFLNEEPIAADDLWLHPDAVYRLQGPGEAPHGWLVLAGAERRPRVQARAEAPEWLPRIDREVIDSASHIGIQREHSVS